MLASALALGSSFAGGASDFLGGTTSRRFGATQFVFCTQFIGLLGACVWVAASREPIPPLLTLAAGAGAGLALMLHMTALFQAMVLGTISLVAPISATGIIIPVVVGIVQGEQPSMAQSAGIVLAIVGVVLVSAPSKGPSSAMGHPALGLTLLAALGGGLFFWLMAPASRHGVPWAMLLARGVPASIMGVTLGIRQSALQVALESRTAAAVLASALLAFSSMTLYAFATRHGELAIVSVLGSLYPGATVLLAYGILGERVHRAQQVGVAALLAGVVMLSV